MPRAQAHVLQIISLTLMFCAGLMALSFWALQCWFDVAWWGMNAWLVALSVVGLWCVTSEQGETA
jgi:peptidoglycan biosynthesis protein MviN/MurJ (putative lipid II flippase)